MQQKELNLTTRLNVESLKKKEAQAPEAEQLLEEDLPKHLPGEKQKEPINLLNSLSQYKDLCAVLCQQLDETSLKKIGSATLLSHQYEKLFTASKTTYLRETRAVRAETLRGFIMNWNYDEIVKLVKIDPKVLAVRLPYQMNKWLKAKELTEKNSRKLSALEFAWWTGDENFIALFERVGEIAQIERGETSILHKSCIKNKASLMAEWIAYRDDLTGALKQFADDNDRWEYLMPLWIEAPGWIVALSYHMSQTNCYSEKSALEIDIFSLAFRGRWGLLVGGLPWCGPAPAVSRYLSKLHTDGAADSVSRLVAPRIII